MRWLSVWISAGDTATFGDRALPQAGQPRAAAGGGKPRVNGNVLIILMRTFPLTRPAGAWRAGVDEKPLTRPSRSR